MLDQTHKPSVWYWSYLLPLGQKHQRNWHYWSRRSSRCWPAGNGSRSICVSNGWTAHIYTWKQRYTTSKIFLLIKPFLLDSHFLGWIICFLLRLPDLPLPAELQGVSWDGPTDVSKSITEALTEEEPLYAVPRKDHQPKFTVDDFILHKMLGKGSFGKVLEVIWFKKIKAQNRMYIRTEGVASIGNSQY